MKKFLLGLLILFLFPFMAGADSVVTVGDPVFYVVNGEKAVCTITISWTAHTDGTVTATAVPLVTDGLQGWRLYSVETNPGSTGPQASYDITLVDSQGLDMSAGKLTDLSATATEGKNISSTTLIYPVITENFTFTLANNNVNGATGVLILTFVAKP